MSDPTYSPPPADRSVKVPHLVFGLLFLGVAVVWALIAGDVITPDRLTVLAPAVLIVAGVIGLAASLASGRNGRRRPARNEPWATDTSTNTSTYDTSSFETSTPDTRVEGTTERVVTDDDDHTEEIR